MNLRDYGLPDADEYMDGKPEVMREENIPCPHCGCEKTFSIEIPLKDFPLVKKGEQRGSYVGCAACPWASPMMISGKAEGT